MPLPLAIPAMIAGGTALSGVSQFLGGLHQASAANKNYKLKKENLEYQKRLKKLRGKGRTMQYKDVPKTSRPPDCPKLLPPALPLKPWHQSEPKPRKSIHKPLLRDIAE